jgi:hypothetical protein
MLLFNQNILKLFVFSLLNLKFICRRFKLCDCTIVGTFLYHEYPMLEVLTVSNTAQLTCQHYIIRNEAGLSSIFYLTPIVVSIDLFELAL